MSLLTRYLLFITCLLLLTSVVPPQPALANGDPDEVVERTPPLPPLQIPTPPVPGPRGLRGDPDEMPDGGLGDDEGDGGGQDFPGGGPGLRGVGGWIPILLEIMRYGVLAAC
jgi:hypothetical protein